MSVRRIRSRGSRYNTYLLVEMPYPLGDVSNHVGWSTTDLKSSLVVCPHHYFRFFSQDVDDFFIFFHLVLDLHVRPSNWSSSVWSWFIITKNKRVTEISHKEPKRLMSTKPFLKLLTNIFWLLTTNIIYQHVAYITRPICFTPLEPRLTYIFYAHHIELPND